MTATTRTEKLRDAYGYQWALSKKKETFIKDLIESNTGAEVEFWGMGAGETVRVSGSAHDNGFAVGAPDLHIKGTPFFIEVTGPNTFTAESNSSIWVRPDKIRHAYYALKEGKTTFLVHILPKSTVRRCMDNLGADFMLCHEDNPLAERARIRLGSILARAKGRQADEELLRLGRAMNNRGELFDFSRPKSFDNDILAVIPFDENYFETCEKLKMVRYDKKGIREEFVKIERQSSYVKTMDDLYKLVRNNL